MRKYVLYGIFLCNSIIGYAQIQIGYKDGYSGRRLNLGYTFNVSDDWKSTLALGINHADGFFPDKRYYKWQDRIKPESIIERFALTSKVEYYGFQGAFQHVFAYSSIYVSYSSTLTDLIVDFYIDDTLDYKDPPYQTLIRLQNKPVLWLEVGAGLGLDIPVHENVKPFVSSGIFLGTNYGRDTYMGKINPPKFNEWKFNVEFEVGFKIQLNTQKSSP